jgi:CRISPR-associated endonuclease/helicase Cas3
MEQVGSGELGCPHRCNDSRPILESLYACKTSRCRKLHNIANSVVIFDEAQSFPTEYLRPAVFAIRELHQHYGVTPVLCTATQPVLTKTEEFDFKFREGFDSVIEIIDEPDSLAHRLKRVEVSLLSDSLAPVELATVASAMTEEGESVLCIVNRKDDCRELARLLPKEQVIHLSTNMCAEHRFRTFAHIRNRLNTPDAPFLVVSTSLVEAGVDLDFPVVYRALAGLDSIAQAAGRCNREGRTPSPGRTVVFVPENQPIYVRQPAGIASEFLSADLSSLFSPSNYERFFRQRFWQLGQDQLDKYGVLSLLSERMNYYFRTAAETFRLIRDDWQLPVIVPYGEAQETIDRMIDEPWRERFHRRRLQRYVINIERRLHGELVSRDYIHEVAAVPGTFTLDPMLYDECFGFIPPDGEPHMEPTSLIA